MSAWLSLVMSFVIMPVSANPATSSATDDDTAEPAAAVSNDLEQLLSQVKAQFPDGSILRVDRRDAGKTAVGYDVKVLASDGCILRLTFDAHSHKLANFTSGHGSHQHQSRLGKTN